MLAPILPSPIIPSCIDIAPVHSCLSSFTVPLRQALPDCRLQFRESCTYVFAEVHAKRTSAALRKYREIATRLRCFDHPKRIFLFRDRKIVGIVTSDLQEDTAVGSAFIGLACRVQKPRPKSENSRQLLGVSDRMADALQSGFILSVHRDVAEHSEIIPCAGARQMSFQDLRERFSVLKSFSVPRVRVELHAAAFEEGLLFWQLALCFILACEFPRFDLAGFYVRLVEGIDADDRSSHGGRNFPAEEPFTNHLRPLALEAPDWLPCFLQTFHHRLPRVFGAGVHAPQRKYPVTPPPRRPRQPLPVHGNDSLPDFSRRFREKLFKPRAKIRNARRRNDRYFVAPLGCRGSEDRSQYHAGILRRGNRCPAGMNHFLSAAQELRHINSHHRRRHHAEIR